MKLQRLISCFVAMFLLAIMVNDLFGQAPDGPPNTQTLQSLCRTPNGFFGHYLSIDFEDGEVNMSKKNDLDHSETYWEITRRQSHTRDYVTHTIRQRGNNTYNGAYLKLDSESAELTLSDMHGAGTDFIIRYAGLYKGYNSYYIQTVTDVKGELDFGYVGVDQETGKSVLFRTPVAETRWFMSPGPNVSGEQIRVVKRY